MFDDTEAQRAEQREWEEMVGLSDPEGAAFRGRAKEREAERAWAGVEEIVQAGIERADAADAELLGELARLWAPAGRRSPFVAREAERAMPLEEFNFMRPSAMPPRRREVDLLAEARRTGQLAEEFRTIRRRAI